MTDVDYFFVTRKTSLNHDHPIKSRRFCFAELNWAGWLIGQNVDHLIKGYN